MSKRRKGFPTIEESIKFFEGMTPAQRQAMRRGIENARENKKRKVKYDIDPFSGQMGFRFNKGGIVSRVRKTKYF